MQDVTVTSVISTTPTASEQSTTGTRQTTVEMNINVPYKNEQITKYYKLYTCWCYIKIQMQELKVVLSITRQYKIEYTLEKALTISRLSSKIKNG